MQLLSYILIGVSLFLLGYRVGYNLAIDKHLQALDDIRKEVDRMRQEMQHKYE